MPTITLGSGFPSRRHRDERPKRGAGEPVRRLITQIAHEQTGDQARGRPWLSSTWTGTGRALAVSLKSLRLILQEYRAVKRVSG